MVSIIDDFGECGVDWASMIGRVCCETDKGERSSIGGHYDTSVST